ncbi:MAG: LacI family DNA-binding transcriptional regulator, partial [Verrucomicrobiota bacterium]
MASPKSKRSTIYDLARIANVSPGTVSRVLNNKDKVKAATRERVLKAAQQLDLKPQASVRAKQIALVMEPRFENRFRGYSAILLAHLSFALTSRKYGLFIPENPVEELKDYFLDGIIAISFEKEIKELLANLEKRTPVVYLDNFEKRKGIYTVRSDHYEAGRIAAKHLIEKGKTKLAYLASNTLANQIRAQGFADAIEETGIKRDPRLSALESKDSTSPTVISRLIRNGADSIFAPGTSHEVLRVVHNIEYVMGLKVPEDISVIGGENMGITEFIN